MVKNIMVVEDENIIALDIKHRLRSMGFNIAAVVPTGEEAINVATTVKPDLILMDIALRGKLTGVQAAKNITKREKIPVIFLTSYSDEKTKRQAAKVSPHGYLLKPFNEYELKYLIDQVS